MLMSARLLCFEYSFQDKYCIVFINSYTNMDWKIKLLFIEDRLASKIKKSVRSNLHVFDMNMQLGSEK